MDEETRFLASGDTGLTVELGDEICRRISQRVVRLRAAITEAGLTGVIETVPTYRSVLVHYDPVQTSHARLVDAITPLLRLDGRIAEQQPRKLRLPICFDGPDFAPDLTDVANWSGKSASDVMNALTGADLHTYMLGFAPGQPYLGDLPEWMAIPRRQDPVSRIPAGSVVVAARMVSVYPMPNPTGWHVVGRTPARLFDPSLSEPALFRAGDTVVFHRVDADEFALLSAGIKDGDQRQLLGLDG